MPVVGEAPAPLPVPEERSWVRITGWPAASMSATTYSSSAGAGGGGLAVHAHEPAGGRPVNQVALDRREDVLPSGCGQCQCLTGVTDNVACRSKGEAGMTQQLAVSGLGDGRDQSARRDSAGHFIGVVGPQHGIGLAVDGPNGVATAGRFGGGEQTYSDVTDPHRIMGFKLGRGDHRVIVERAADGTLG
jgi:hypothetical protein